MWTHGMELVRQADIVRAPRIRIYVAETNHFGCILLPSCQPGLAWPYSRRLIPVTQRFAVSERRPFVYYK